MVMEDDIRLEVATKPRLLGVVRAMVRSYLQSKGFSAETVDLAVLAVDEACANSIRHSYGSRTDCRMELRVRMTDTHVEFELNDNGVPLDPDRCARRELVPPELNALRPGGLGVQLMYRVFDEITFEPGGERGNRTLMRLQRPPSGQSARRAHDA